MLFSFLSSIFSTRLFWALLAALCLILEAIALYYQYQLGYPPCVLCIHVRMLLAGLLLISVLGLIFWSVRTLTILLMVAASGLWLWMTERSYQLLGTEQGWIMGECQMKSGLPDWLALEQWMPWLFHIHEPCGYTPYLWMKISMAEALIVLSPVMAALCLMALFLRLRRRPA